MSNHPKTTEPKSFIGPFDSKIDYEAREKLITARVGLLIKAPFFGNLVTRLKLVNADETIDTIATDGRNFYYNSRFVNFLTAGELEFGFGHEILHCIFDHFDRRELRHKKLANIAADYCVNATLKKHNVGKFITSVPCLYDSKYEDWSFEQVYDDLLSQMEHMDIDELIKQLLDEHLEISEGDESEGGAPTIKASELEDIKNELREALVTAAQTTNDPGSIPASVRRVIESITEPKIDWRALVQAFLKSTIKTDFSWLKASRRGWHCDAVMPGMNGRDKISLAIAFDASGSITDDMARDQKSEIVSIMETFPEFNIHLFSFDTQVHNPVDLSNDSLDSIMDYQIIGGGGTDISVIFDYMKKNEILPERLIVFTDLESSRFGDPDYVDTLWVVPTTRGYQTPDAPFGQTVRYEGS